MAKEKFSLEYIADEFSRDARDIVKIAQEFGYKATNVKSTLTLAQAEAIGRFLETGERPQPPKPAEPPKPKKSATANKSDEKKPSAKNDDKGADGTAKAKESGATKTKPKAVKKESADGAANSNLAGADGAGADDTGAKNKRKAKPSAAESAANESAAADKKKKPASAKKPQETKGAGKGAGEKIKKKGIKSVSDLGEMVSAEGAEAVVGADNGAVGGAANLNSADAQDGAKSAAKGGKRGVKGKTPANAGEVAAGAVNSNLDVGVAGADIGVAGAANSNLASSAASGGAKSGANAANSNLDVGADLAGANLPTAASANSAGAKSTATPATTATQTPAATTPTPPATTTLGAAAAGTPEIKKRGLIIVKKKNQATKAVSAAKSAAFEDMSVKFGAMFGSGEGGERKKKKDKKPAAKAARRAADEKMDWLGGDFKFEAHIEDENEIFLPDFTVKPIEVEKPQTIKRQMTVYKTAQTQRFDTAGAGGAGSGEGGIARRGRKKHRRAQAHDSEIVTSVEIASEVRVYEFAEKIKKSVSEVISKLFALGKMTTKNDFLGEDEIEILADEFGIDVSLRDEKSEFELGEAADELAASDNLAPRAPVITIMGHVDHGKTSLLDYIRNARVASGEAGGITQHVGAYMTEKNGRKITFIDTPGHEAFSAMRARGASVTDIVIIVVAADDGVKPQTKEAVSHAKAAGVPIIIAINKMDKPGANPDLVKSGLAELDIMPTEWGGAHEFVEISAKTGQGVEELLEVVLLQADILELQADSAARARAQVIESSLQKGRGAVATVVVQNGTLRAGDIVVAGVAYGRVRALYDDKGAKLAAIAPGECGVVVGLSEVPDAGESLVAVESEREARDFATKKQEYLRHKELSRSTKVTLEELGAKIAEGALKSLPVIVKADVGGSVEAICASLARLRNEEIFVDVIHSGVGGISVGDIALADASQNCVILGFNVRPTGEVKAQAKEKGVEIRTYNVIYNLLDDVKALLSGMMSPVVSEEEVGQAVIKQVISVPRIGQVAGCLVTEGSISRGAKIRVIRNGVVVFSGNVSSLRRFKDDVREVAKGYECGVGIEGYADMREGDYIESFKEVETQAQI